MGCNVWVRVRMGWSVGGSKVFCKVISRRPWEDGWSASSIARIPDSALVPEEHRAAGVPRARDARIRLIRHQSNRGMGAGMRSGYAAARQDYLCMIPADGQVPAAHIEQLLPGLEHAPIVTSVYTRRHSQRYRVLLSGGLRLFMRLLLGISVKLEGIYLVPRRVIEEVGLDTIKSSTFFFSFELLARAISRGTPSYTVEIEPQARVAGASKVANLRRVWQVAREVMALRWRLLKEGRWRP